VLIAAKSIQCSGQVAIKEWPLLRPFLIGIYDGSEPLQRIRQFFVVQNQIASNDGGLFQLAHRSLPPICRRRKTINGIGVQRGHHFGVAFEEPGIQIHRVHVALHNQRKNIKHFGYIAFASENVLDAFQEFFKQASYKMI